MRDCRGKVRSSRLATLRNLVRIVVGFGSKKQAFQFDARGRVAFVENAQTIWDGSVRVNPRPDMRAFLDLFVSKATVAAAKGSLPEAASVWMSLRVKIKTLAQSHIVRDGFSGIVLGRHYRCPLTVLLEPVRRFNVARLAIIA